MPLEYSLNAQTSNSGCGDLFDRRLHASRTPYLNTTDSVLSCGLEIT